MDNPGSQDGCTLVLNFAGTPCKSHYNRKHKPSGNYYNQYTHHQDSYIHTRSSYVDLTIRLDDKLGQAAQKDTHSNVTSLTPAHCVVSEQSTSNLLLRKKRLYSRGPISLSNQHYIPNWRHRCHLTGWHPQSLGTVV